jgi:hypothetical protein
VRAALLALAKRDADRVLAAADADVAATLAEGEAEAGQIESAARAAAETDAATLLAVEQARANRRARTMELQARRVAYDELVRRARDAVRDLSGEPGLMDRLTRLARSELGADATVVDSPDGGIVAEAGGRRVSYALTALAEQAVTDLLTARKGT